MNEKSVEDFLLAWLAKNDATNSLEMLVVHHQLRIQGIMFFGLFEVIGGFFKSF